ncbi:MAG: hypothetical protein AAFX07_14035, partial [Pseudomonadota bacterium]
MMTLKSTTALICAGLVLAACGGGGGTTTIDASTTSAPSTVSRFYQSNFIDPGETEYDALEEGLVYYLGTTDGQVNEFHIRIDRKNTPDDPTDDELFVSRNGGETLVYTPMPDQTVDSGSRLNTVFINNEDGDDERQLFVR